MITSISIKNFRSIQSADVALAPITVLYGPTSSGKSSLLYATQVLRNFVLNPNRPPDAFFHLGFMDLGGFDACVFNHDLSQDVCITITHGEDESLASYGLSFSKTAGTIRFKSGTLPVLHAKVALPYSLNQTFSFAYQEKALGFIDEAQLIAKAVAPNGSLPNSSEPHEYAINWNGIICNITPKKPTAETQQRAVELTTSANKSVEFLKAIDIAPHRRGFFKPNYSSVGISPTPTTEDEVASLIMNDTNMDARISVYAEDIFGCDFRSQIAPGTATAFFRVTNKQSRIPSLLVNEGFGVNQIIYLLAKILRVDARTILIEEPEVHLHPTLLRKFAQTACALSKDEHKQLIFTTHSELFLTSILTLISEGKLKPDEIKCYLTSKDKKATAFNPQKVQATGQIEGGLSSFLEAELEDLRKFLGVK